MISIAKHTVVYGKNKIHKSSQFQRIEYRNLKHPTLLVGFLISDRNEVELQRIQVSRMCLDKVSITNFD